jgi:tetratricopeptide (TPR) repeat protein
MYEKISFLFRFTILIASTLFFLGCASTKESFQIEGNYKELLEKQKTSYSDNLLESENLPEISCSEYEQIGDLNLKRDRLSVAYINYERALKCGDDNFRLEYKKGLVNLYGKIYDEAVKQFKNILTKDPRNALAHEKIGIAYFQTKNYIYAERHFWKALEYDFKLWKSHNFLGVIYDYRNMHEKAISRYRSAIQVNPENAALYNNLGISFYLSGQYKEAYESLLHARKLDSGSDRIQNNIALVLFKLKNYDKALLAFKNAGDLAQAYNNLGCVFLAEGRKKEAIRNFEKALESRPKFYNIANENLERIQLFK